MVKHSVISVAILSALYNILLQILARILSSLSNAVIFRLIAKEALGVINVRLLFLYSTCHCFSREAFRRSCLGKFEKEILNQKFNLLWMIVPLCLTCSMILRYIWLYYLELPDPDLVPNYSAGVNAVTISVFIEILAEPLYVFSQSCYFVKLKVVIEGLMLTVRSLSMVFLLSKWPHQSMHCFCISQLLSSVVYTMSFYGYFAYFLSSNQSKDDNVLPVKSLVDMLPSISKHFVSWEDVCLTWSFFKQTLLKQLQAEGERYLMTFFNLITFAEQGLYNVVDNLGSLAARFIFSPIEQSTYVLFNQLLSRDRGTLSQENISMSQTVLRNVLKLLILLGLTILTFGFSYSQLLLHLYGGSQLSTGGLTLMRWHCLHVLLMAVNGVTEGFKFAVMNPNEIDRYNWIFVLLPVIYVAAAVSFVRMFGSVGFILANCLNMLIRTAHSVSFIGDYFKVSSLWWLSTLPHVHVFLCLGSMLLLTSISEMYLCCESIHVWIWHFLLGASSFSVFLALLWFTEKELFLFLLQQWRKRDSSESKLKAS